MTGLRIGEGGEQFGFVIHISPKDLEYDLFSIYPDDSEEEIAKTVAAASNEVIASVRDQLLPKELLGKKLYLTATPISYTKEGPSEIFIFGFDAQTPILVRNAISACILSGWNPAEEEKWIPLEPDDTVFDFEEDEDFDENEEEHEEPFSYAKGDFSERNIVKMEYALDSLSHIYRLPLVAGDTSLPLGRIYVQNGTYYLLTERILDDFLEKTKIPQSAKLVADVEDILQAYQIEEDVEESIEE